MCITHTNNNFTGIFTSSNSSTHTSSPSPLPFAYTVFISLSYDTRFLSQYGSATLSNKRLNSYLHSNTPTITHLVLDSLNSSRFQYLLHHFAKLADTQLFTILASQHVTEVVEESHASHQLNTFTILYVVRTQQLFTLTRCQRTLRFIFLTNTVVTLSLLTYLHEITNQTTQNQSTRSHYHINYSLTHSLPT